MKRFADSRSVRAAPLQCKWDRNEEYHRTWKRGTKERGDALNVSVIRTYEKSAINAYIDISK